MSLLVHNGDNGNLEGAARLGVVPATVVNELLEGAVGVEVAQPEPLPPCGGGGGIATGRAEGERPLTRSMGSGPKTTARHHEYPKRFRRV